MTIDRLLITCSVVELTYCGYESGLTGLTVFQWAALMLLATKLILILRRWYGRHPTK